MPVIEVLLSKRNSRSLCHQCQLGIEVAEKDAYAIPIFSILSSTCLNQRSPGSPVLGAVEGEFKSCGNHGLSVSIELEELDMGMLGVAMLWSRTRWWLERSR